MSKIVTFHTNPPIPLREFDWSATREDYEPGDRMGFGTTEEEAVRNLEQQEHEDTMTAEQLVGVYSALLREAGDLLDTAYYFEHENYTWDRNYRILREVAEGHGIVL